MRKEGSRSWRFAHDLGQMPQAAVYVRDALRLPVADVSTVPPRLLGDVPDHSELLPPASVDAASSDWMRWWDEVLDADARVQLGDQEFSRARYHEVLDPSTSSTLSDSPLRDAAITLFAEGCRWADAARRPEIPPQGPGTGSFPWELTRDCAESVAAEAGVDASEVSGAVLVLLVRGVWWTLVRPQYAVCSIAAVNDPELTQKILRTVFTSGVFRR